MEDLNTMTNQTKVCLMLPAMVQSRGLAIQFLNHKTKDNHIWYDYSLPRFQLQLTLIFIVSQFFHFFLKRLGLPLFTSLLMTGLVLSPSVLGELSNKIWPEESIQILGAMTYLGYGFYLFLVGVKTDPSAITRVNLRTFSIGILAILAPLICSVPIIISAFNSKIERNQKIGIFFLSSNYCSVFYPVISQILGDLKIVNSELGRIINSAALITDMYSISLVLCGVMLRKWKVDGLTQALSEFTYVIVFFIIIFIIIRPLIYFGVKKTPEGKPINESYIYGVMMIFLVVMGLTKTTKYMPLAAYIFGLTIPHGPPFGSALVEKFEYLIQNMFVPLFVVSCGLRNQSFDLSGGSKFYKVNVAIVTMAPLVRVLACFLPSYLTSMPRKDALAIALLMTSKGVVDLAIIASFSDASIIDYKLYTYQYLIILYLSILIPIAVKHLYDPTRKYAGYTKRNLLNWKPFTDLHILTVIHVPDNVDSVLNLLEATCPTKENPLVVNVLHLIKLNGQTNPIFIAHNNKRHNDYTNSYSENLIISFNKFQGVNYGGVSVNAYTAVSPPNVMHDDICTLALDNFASIVILPFHRRWYMDGTIESDNDYIRTLNTRVLEKSPCSIGILIDRGNTRRISTPSDTSFTEPPLYKVAMIFLGGTDDREALTLVKRMSSDTRVSTTILHLTANLDDTHQNWDYVIDNEMLRDVKTNGYINYVEKEVADGPETAMIVHSMVNEFNLIVVGRRYDVGFSPQTCGLEEWSEFPELGVLGDLLASIDYSGRCSVLVVQQQESVVNSKPKIDFLS